MKSRVQSGWRLGRNWNLFRGEKEMKKRLMFGALLVIMAALSLHDLAGFAQSVITPPGKLVTSAQWKKMIDDEKPPLGAVAGQTARILQPEAFVIRRRLSGPNNASVHSKEVGFASFAMGCWTRSRSPAFRR